MKRFLSAFSVLSTLLLIASLAGAQPATQDAAPMNLLLNPFFDFHAFNNSRTGSSRAWSSGAVACWDIENYGDIEALRAPRVRQFRPVFTVDNVVRIAPGKTLSQFATLAEMKLDHGEHVSLSVRGFQTAPGALRMQIHQMRADSQSGSWKPSDFGQADKREFPRMARGELIKAQTATATSGAEKEFLVKLENQEIVGAFTENPNASTDQPNTIGLQVEFTNVSDADVWIYAPYLSATAAAITSNPQRAPVLRAMPEYYRGIPRTIQKLWRGEPLHIIVMGSSIDRGSANPPLYLYDEDPASPNFKQPIAGDLFDGALVGHPEWNDYIGQWRHYFMYGGRLRRALMSKFDYPIDKLLLNTMAADGSSISEAHSGLAEYSALQLPPDPELNGHKSGKSWQELYPAVFARPEGTRPDLVIFGSGANEKVDGADETALFEGAIRWFQRHYPDVEFLFCMWQNREEYTRNTGSLQELALRYQIPFIDFGREFNLVTRHANSYALAPRDGHPQAAAHYLWSKQIERAFDVADPIRSGIAQLHLPARANPFTVGWEGEVHTYEAGQPRLRHDTGFIFDDTVINVWATTADKLVGFRIDGKENTGSRRKPMTKRDLRNSTFAIGRLSLGDRHVLEVTGESSKLVAVDAKTALNRRWIGAGSALWNLNGTQAQPFVSQWGAPYGETQVILAPGQSAQVEVAGTDFSVAWVDDENGGTLQTFVDSDEKWRQPTNIGFELASGETVYFENRKAIRGLPFGMHTIRVQAADGPVALLGVFAYDTRPNHDNQRVLHGLAASGETVNFSTPFQARPLVLAGGGLKVQNVTPNFVRFGGDAAGSYEIVGE